VSVSGGDVLRFNEMAQEFLRWRMAVPLRPVSVLTHRGGNRLHSTHEPIMA
jgi:hypothetical protein